MGACRIARALLRLAAEAGGVTLLEKHGGVTTPVAQLIEASEAVVLVYGGEEPAVEDVWGLSLVELEMRYASVRKKPVLGVLLDSTERMGATMTRLRGHLERQLGPAMLHLQGLPESTDFSLAQVAVVHAWCLQYQRPFPADMRQALVQELGPGEARDWCDPRVAPGILARQAAQRGIVLPSVSALMEMLSQLETLLVDWQQRAAPVFNDRIFLSYAHADRALAVALEQALEAVGLEPWRDQNHLRKGEQFLEIIRHEIEHSGAFVVLLSPESAGSRWVRWEIEHAKATEQRYGDDTFFVFPICLENTALEPFPSLSGCNHITLTPTTDPAQLARLLRADLDRRRHEARIRR